MKIQNCFGKNGDRQTSFTIVERLLVVSIIAILISILLPALHKARESGHKISCISNLKQYAQIFNSYAADNKGCYPYAHNPADYTNWQGLTQGYFDSKKNNVLYCLRHHELDSSLAGYEEKNRSNNNYGVNGWLYKNLDLKPERLRQPSQVCLMSEVRWSGSYYPAELNGRLPDSPSHQGHANVLFVDGHAATVSYRIIPCEQGYNFTPWGGALTWGGSWGQTGHYRFWSSSRIPSDSLWTKFQY